MLYRFTRSLVSLDSWGFSMTHCPKGWQGSFACPTLNVSLSAVCLPNAFGPQPTDQSNADRAVTLYPSATPETR